MAYARSHAQAAGALAAVAALAATATGCRSTPYREVEVDLATTAAAREGDPLDRADLTLHFSVAAMISPRDTYPAYSRLFSHVSNRLGVKIELELRRSYREVNDMLLDGSLDAAFVCTGGYLDLSRRSPAAIEILAVPVVGGGTEYHSLLITAAGSPVREIGDLAGKRFAFTDELSLTGRAWAIHRLRRHHADPARFFASTLFTRSHDRSVQAVERGLVDGAAVDSLVFDYLVARDPGLAGRVRLVERSVPFGMPPVVVSTRVSAETRARLREVLLGLERDPAAAALLRELRIDRFVAPPPGLYASARAVLEDVW